MATGLGETAGQALSMVLVANGQAGALLEQGDGSAGLEAMLRAQAASLEVIAADAGSLPERVDKALATGAACVVMAGGDGSVACAAQALAGTATALGLIPGGTMNLLAHDLGLDPDDHAACVRVLGEGRVRAIDVGCVTDADGTSQLFLCASMLGTPAALSRHREAGRRQGNGVLAWAGFGLAAGRALWRNRSRHLTLGLGGGTLRRTTPSLTVVVNRLDDASGRMFGRTCLDGGTLAVYVVGRRSVLRTVWLLLRTAASGSLRASEIEVVETEAVEVGCRHRAIHVLVDGELRLMRPPLRYSIRPGALRVVAPAARA